MTASPATHPLQRVDGVPECTLGDALASRLPDRSAAAPWQTRVQAVMWFHPAADGAAELLPPRLRGERTIPLTIGAFIRYLDTPVGPYSEVLAAPVLLARTPLPASVVPFIAVDSLPSIHGGRANWALPKTLAAFEWTAAPPQLGEGPFSVRGEGTHGPSAWSVAATVSPRRRRLPIRFPLRDVQLTPDERELDIPIFVSGRAQLASAEISSSGPSLPAWLLPGRHRALVLPQARMTFGAPR
ncbi:acetoacetate decarboxylase family protein [Conexibacter stalactiti]|uniref:Acetoacetate decarboxylase family protein n=1 Tax=Conexibacter stalactiti TaxID=1940611 RepID=A0ABU4HQM0_9ACTN|nr:acetoacetate decarboxylase family protein [Conexibacter stalactiti]MDW5595600.1 acetoacetate decarboxylase family protein [Conexibacter stalactiti]MEC5036242.1 acetoacetate decarboxylase family protein [Conexibacter stalactiti]